MMPVRAGRLLLHPSLSRLCPERTLRSGCVSTRGHRIRSEQGGSRECWAALCLLGRVKTTCPGGIPGGSVVKTSPSNAGSRGARISLASGPKTRNIKQCDKFKRDLKNGPHQKVIEQANNSVPVFSNRGKPSSLDSLPSRPGWSSPFFTVFGYLLSHV